MEHHREARSLVGGSVRRTQIKVQRKERAGGWDLRQFLRRASPISSSAPRNHGPLSGHINLLLPVNVADMYPDCVSGGRRQSLMW